MLVSQTRDTHNQLLAESTASRPADCNSVDQDEGNLGVTQAKAEKWGKENLNF